MGTLMSQHFQGTATGQGKGLTCHRAFRLLGILLFQTINSETQCLTHLQNPNLPESVELLHEEN
jgi:hypothetical protein